MTTEEIKKQAVRFADDWVDGIPADYGRVGFDAAYDGFRAGFRAASQWNRITDDPASLPEPGRLVLLAWEKDKTHEGKPYVEREVYKLEREPNGDLYFWAHHSGDTSQELFGEDDMPTHWMYFPEPPQGGTG